MSFYIDTDECLICVRYNYRLIRNRLHFELTWDHLRQDGVIRKQIPQEDNSQRGKLVKEAIKFGPRGCESLLRCLEMQQKETYKHVLEVWKKRKTFGRHTEYLNYKFKNGVYIYVHQHFQKEYSSMSLS